LKITLLLKRLFNPNQAHSLMTLTRKISSLALLLFCLAETCFSQPGTQVDLKKPQEYENRKLRSEETGEKKMGLRKRIFQNTYTHYNYFFNANNKMNEVIERAKASYKDDYTKLLPFYPYTLDGTAQQRNEIDSVIYKCTAGILLHDLRNDWIDNLYMLMGKAYMFRKDFDSATQTFQYINYAYSPKDGGYDVAIGSNSSNTNGVFTIATKESKNVLKKAVTHPPSRNESFIWQARNYVEQGELSDAAGLIEILRADPNFPKRLRTELNEVIAYWFYHQNAYDSSAHYLSLALSEADTRQDKARWEYLIGQLYALAGKNDLAVKYFDRAINHSIDPVMEVYARLNAIRINNSGKKDSYIQDNLNDLLKMAKKDKYENYKDIIYYTAAQVELERNNTAGAIKWLKKSVEASSNNPAQKAESFLLLADLNYNTKGYIDASKYYDSTAIESLRIEKDKARVTDRRPALKTISSNVQKINLQDSLQRIAAMPEAEREAYIRKLVKQFRKAKGLKDEPGSSGSSGSGATDLFADTKADWYFSNPNLRSKGFSEFKSRWGDRPNVDNWRRQQAVNRAKVDVNVVPGNDVGDKDTSKDEEISYESILAKLPLTQQQIDASNGIIQKALYENGQVFEDKLEDYQSAIEVFEELLRRFPNAPQKEQILFNLVYMYGKVNNPAKQQAAREQLIREFPNGKLTQTVKEVSTSTNTGKKVDAATKKYEQIYNLFIEGKFSEAVAEKRAADAQYGNSYWTPQLLFIESIYYIKQREDSTAINRLTALKTQFAKSPLAEKAARMIDVLSRRKQIEDYLTNLDVERKENEQVKRVDMDNQQIATAPVTTSKEVPNKTVGTDKPLTIKADTLAKAPVIAGSKTFVFDASDKHFALVILDNIDGMYVSEVRNAFNRWNGERYAAYRLNVSTQPLNEKLNLVLIGPFKDAAMATDYVTKTKPQAAGSILPWLSADKFSFLIISNANLQLLNENKDLPAYRKLITETLPGKF
jgi:tetratricopeptide (TPR) repeat protein